MKRILFFSCLLFGCTTQLGMVVTDVRLDKDHEDRIVVEKCTLESFANGLTAPNLSLKNCDTKTIHPAASK